MDLSQAINATLEMFKKQAIQTKRETWQGLDVRGRPDMVTHEVVGHRLVAEMNGRHLPYYVKQISPDLPWADDHFDERISGKPLNPPPSEVYWPHAPKGNEAFKAGGVFSHTYPERMWPKWAREDNLPMQGIRYPYGDYRDFINLLEREPYTRQAYLPIWFPEDTGNVQKVRTPCTLGYHFLLTGDTLDVFYFIRSCDLVRHFRNDIYFTIRLMLDVLHRLRTPPWPVVHPRNFYMSIGSLHCFANDWRTLFPDRREESVSV